MDYQMIGQAPVKASRIALGCMRMSELSVDSSRLVIEKAVENGINFFDHADIYGKGQSEVRFSEALKGTSIQREQIYLQSKCGIRSGWFDFSQEHIVHSVDGILERLQTDYLDFLLLHRPDTLMEPEEVAAALTQLHASGKVRYFGVSNQNPWQMALLQQALDMPLVVNQLEFGPAHTVMIDAGLNVNMKNDAATVRDGGVLEYCRLHNITIQPWSPFQVDLSQGLFINHPEYQTLTTTLKRYAQEKGTTFEAMVMAWILRHPAKMQPIVGSMNPQRIADMCEGVRIELTRQEWYEIYRSAGNVLP